MNKVPDFIDETPLDVPDVSLCKSNIQPDADVLFFIGTVEGGGQDISLTEVALGSWFYLWKSKLLSERTIVSLIFG